LPEHVRIVDLSADFRLHDLSAYEAWYGHAHRAPALQTKAVYGLTEHARDAVCAARLVANPGCYPTCSLLPILPLVKEKLIASDRLIIDAMSGVSGAGRKATQAMLFCEVNEGVRAYGVGGHRHVAEMEQEVSRVAGKETAVSFTAHLVPMNRGMSATIHTHVPEGVKAKDLRAALALRYANEPFVRVCAEGVIPSTQEVRGTNECRIAVVDDRRSGKAILVSVIDNLVKGASGQAIQNLNVMYGWPETTGLQQYALYP
jgi:N-acetyl-gamma-glutamyl-phosphate reductase